ncbi:MAG: hypothetical protein AAF944_22580 [Bacteroidota bacterium]
MLPVVEAIIIYAVEEIIALLIFYIVRKFFRDTSDPDQKSRSVAGTAYFNEG